MTIAIILFLLVTVALAIFRRPKSDQEYLILSRSVPALGVAAATFTLIGGGEFLTLTALSYVYGFWAITYFAGVVLGFIVLALLSRKAREMAEAHDFHSLPDFLFFQYGKGVARLSTIISFLGLGALLVIQFVVGGQIINALSGMPIWAGVLLMCASVLLYLYFSGFKGVLATDIFQAVVMIITTAIVAWFAFDVATSQGINISAIAHTAPTFIETAIFFLLGLFAVLGGADVWQRVFSSKNYGEAKKGLFLNSIGWLIFGAIFITLAVGIQALLPNADPNNAFIEFVGTSLPQTIQVILAFLILAAVISTADVEMYVLSILLSKEIKRGHVLETSSFVKLGLVGVAILTAVISIFAQNLIQIYFLLLYLVTALGPSVLATLLGRGNKLTIYFAVIGSLAVLIYLAVTNQLVGAMQLLLFVPGILPFLVAKTEPELVK